MPIEPNANLQHWQHEHAFGQDQKRRGELRTIIVIVITTSMMIVEITTGLIFGSMALLADGLHMASHAIALAINAFAYIYARHHAHDIRCSFGTGKVNSLAGFAGAVLLAIFAMVMVWESIERLIYPIEIAYNQAIMVAVLGLIINGASVYILGHDADHDHDHHGHHHHHDHNLRAAYLHVLADALTSFLAIVALFVAKFIGLVWMDPLMGIVGAILVSRWSLGLLHTTSAVLLDNQGPAQLEAKIIQCIEDDDNRVVDLHLWSIGPNIYSVIISVLACDPQPPEYYKELIPSNLGLVHLTVEVNEWIGEDYGN